MRFVVRLLAFVGASAWYTWPLARDGWNHAVHPGELSADVLLVSWILAWDWHALTTAPLRLFEANALHPTPHVLALSEHLLGHLPLFVPFYLAADNAIAGVNAVTFVGFVLAAAMMHWLVFTWTRSEVAALGAALAFALAPSRLFSLGVPHELATYAFPLIALTVDRAAWTGRARDGVWAAGAVTLQVLCSFYLGYMGYVIVAGVIVAHLLVRGPRPSLSSWYALLLALVLPALVTLPIALPYATAVDGEPLATSYLEPLRVFHQQTSFGDIVSAVIGHTVGLPTTLAALPALVLLGVAGPTRERTTRIIAMVLVAVASLALAHGPGGYLYDALVAVVPGFGNLRAPLRFGFLTAFVACVLGGMTIGAMPERVRVLAFIAWMAGVVWLAARLPTSQSWPLPVRPPAVYTWLAEHGEGAPLLEVPMSPEGFARGDALAQFHSTRHWLPLLNGHTGYYPRSRRVILEATRRLPRREALAPLFACTGLRWILVQQCDGREQRRWSRTSDVALRGVFVDSKNEGQCLYEVRKIEGATCPGGWPSYAPVAYGRG